MSRQKSVFISLALFILGFIFDGLAWTTLPGPTYNTLALLFGAFLMILGIILFIISANKTHER